jgi:hypothetical protein
MAVKKNVLDLLLHYRNEELTSLTSSSSYSSAVAESHTGTTVASQGQHRWEEDEEEGLEHIPIYLAHHYYYPHLHRMTSSVVADDNDMSSSLF